MKEAQTAVTRDLSDAPVIANLAVTRVETIVLHAGTGFTIGQMVDKIIMDDATVTKISLDIPRYKD